MEFYTFQLPRDKPDTWNLAADGHTGEGNRNFLSGGAGSVQLTVTPTQPLLTPLICPLPFRNTQECDI